MKVDWVDEAQEVTQRMVDCQVERIRHSLVLSATSLRECAECGNPIPEARRKAVAGVRVCVECQTIMEFNRRVGAGGCHEI